ncbi:MAG: molybdopterin-binding protein [Negativicutes bacterium]|nr:molybdopterin-binding protein [Negativicutes bacterium]
MMKKVHVKDAVGMVIGHDLTRIVPGSYKGTAFPKGHVISAEDIPGLLDIGKEHIYVFELGDHCWHENTAAAILAERISGSNLVLGEAREGRVNITAACRGWLKIDPERVNAINSCEGLALSTLHGDQLVEAGQLLAAAKIIPLVIEKQIIERLTDFAGTISVNKFPSRTLGAVITGNEVFSGRISDRFAGVLKDKAGFYEGVMLPPIYAPDEPEAIGKAIDRLLEMGADIVIAAGGMSVDPDDVTAAAIRSRADHVVKYGTAVLPGAMFMLAYRKNKPIIGLPACGMFARYTVLDLILPRLICGEQLTAGDIVRMGYGGLCRGCETCDFPNCGFGKI